MKNVDLLVIGAGPGGYVAAIKAAQVGMKVACVDERPTLGGTCLNVGCIPSKALLHSSHKLDEAKTEFSKYGIKLSKVELDLDAMQAQKDKSVAELTKGIAFLFQKNKVTFIQGRASLESSSQVKITTPDGKDEIWQAKNILIATGSSNRSIPGVDIDEDKILSSTGALNIKKVPKNMIVIGGGYIGLEMGSVWRRLGSTVTVLEAGERLVPSMDHDLSQHLEKILTKQGLIFKLSSQVKSIEKKKDSVLVTLVNANQETTLEADVVLVAIGRKPHTQNLGLEALGIKCNAQGFIEVNDRYETSLPHVYAIGDVIPGPMLAHKAEEEGIAAVECMVGQKGHVNYNAIPAVVFTSPEVASVGKTEQELKQDNIPYKIGKFPFLANSRAKAIGDTDGFVKVLAHAISDQVLGVHIIGPEAGTLIAEATMAMEFSASAEDIARTTHAHPTFAEALKEAAKAVDGHAIHI